MSKVHIICAKCGSTDISIDPDCFRCRNCGELTGLSEWNEFNPKLYTQQEMEAALEKQRANLLNILGDLRIANYHLSNVDEKECSIDAWDSVSNALDYINAIDGDLSACSGKRR